MLSKPHISATIVSRPGELPKPAGSVFYTLPLEDWLIAEALLLQGRGLQLPLLHTHWHPLPPRRKRLTYDLLGEFTLPHDIEPLIEKRDLAVLALYWPGPCPGAADPLTAYHPQVLVTWASPEDCPQYGVIDLAEVRSGHLDCALASLPCDSALEAALAAHPLQYTSLLGTPAHLPGISALESVTPLVQDWGCVDDLLCQSCGGALCWHAPSGPWSQGSAHCVNSAHASRRGPPPDPPCPTGTYPTLRTPLGVLARLADFRPAGRLEEPPEDSPEGPPEPPDRSVRAGRTKAKAKTREQSEGVAEDGKDTTCYGIYW